MSIRWVMQLGKPRLALLLCLILIGGIVAAAAAREVIGWHSEAGDPTSEQAAGLQQISESPRTDGASSGDSTRYLAFQIFTGGFDSTEMRQAIPPPPGDLRKIVADLRERVGVTSTDGRKLGFVLGPIAFDNTDEQARKLIAVGFDIALETGIAVGFHVDDSMFWGRLGG